MKGDDSNPSLALARALLGSFEGWVASAQYDHQAILTRAADGACISVTLGGHRNEGRVTFRGVWPEYRDRTRYWGDVPPFITCAASRSPEALAREVQRRLLPGYLEGYARAKAIVDQVEERQSEADHVAARLAAVVGGHPDAPLPWRKGDGVLVRGGPEAVSRMRVQPAFGTDNPVGVSFEVHRLDPETAAEVLQVIRASEAGRLRIDSRVRVGADENENENDEEETKESHQKRAAS